LRHGPTAYCPTLVIQQTGFPKPGAFLTINQCEFLAHGTGNVHAHATRQHAEDIRIGFTHGPQVTVGRKLLVSGGVGQFIQYGVGSALKPD
jgi:hypothetical protein